MNYKEGKAFSEAFGLKDATHFVFSIWSHSAWTEEDTESPKASEQLRQFCKGMRAGWRIDLGGQPDLATGWNEKEFDEDVKGFLMLNQEDIDRFWAWLRD